MPASIATLDPAGGTPTVEIIVGHAHFARFDFFLYDASDRNPQLSRNETSVSPYESEKPARADKSFSSAR
jgi:hypothetical protein